jgi:hypothetical protein
MSNPGISGAVSIPAVAEPSAPDGIEDFVRRDAPFAEPFRRWCDEKDL